jgi:hypothetical protein
MLTAAATVARLRKQTDGSRVFPPSYRRVCFRRLRIGWGGVPAVWQLYRDAVDQPAFGGYTAGDDAEHVSVEQRTQPQWRCFGQWVIGHGIRPVRW